MKRIFFLVFAAYALFTSCSKPHYETPTPIPNYITINGTNYATVIINGQTWTALNYNGAGGENYNNNTNDTTQGKLYTWTEAQAIALPSGWRLPTVADFNSLMAATGAAEQPNGSYLVLASEALQLTSTTRWSTTNGSNALGFNAYPAGAYDQGSSGFDQYNGLGTQAVFLSSAPYTAGGTTPACLVITSTTATISNPLLLTTDRGSLRFVMGN
jgi:uncharacterized protein (TIGR02145 family)